MIKTTALFSITLFLSSFLLFFIQPLFSKMILPLFGGSSGIWVAALCFFQVTLLLGYLYAHILIKCLSVTFQVFIYLVTLLACIYFIPFNVDDITIDNYSGILSIKIILLMVSIIGLPFFILSATAPLIQYWFARKYPDRNPYKLYAVSNAGSLIGLLSYPIFFDPLFGVNDLSMLWGLGFLILIITVTIGRSSFSKSEDIKKVDDAEKQDEAINKKQIAIWVLLAFIPAALLPGITRYLTTDITPMPMLWVIPLALYLLSFIFAFKGDKGFFTLKFSLFIQSVIIYMIVSAYIMGFYFYTPLMFALHILLFYFSSLICHKELYALRPHGHNLSYFYLAIAFGGALAGVFMSIIAPLIFPIAVEYVLVIMLALFIRYISDDHHSIANCYRRTKDYISKFGAFAVSNDAIAFITCIIFTFIAIQITDTTMRGFASVLICMSLVFIFDKRFRFAICAALVLFIHPYDKWQNEFSSIYSDRNFFGTIKVYDGKNDDLHIRQLVHGNTFHGQQAVNGKYEFVPLTYYSKHSGVGNIFNLLGSKPANIRQDIAVIGLGIGSIAAYSVNNRYFDFFEIDPAIIKVAKNPKLFTFIDNCGDKCSIIEGDGRVSISKEPKGKYDLIVVDAFSSDAIPIHMITSEAVDIYLSKLKENGYIAFHISNHYLDLTDEIINIARSKNVSSGTIHYDRGGIVDIFKLIYLPSNYIVITKNIEGLNELKKHSDLLVIDEYSKVEINPWTDDHNFILRAFK